MVRDLALKQNSSRAAAPRRRLRSYRRFSACARRCETATCRPLSSHRHITAVLIIAFIYSGGLQSAGFIVASLGILMVIGLQHVGLGSALMYILPGAAVWIGFLMTGGPIRPLSMSCSA